MKAKEINVDDIIASDKQVYNFKNIFKNSCRKLQNLLQKKILIKFQLILKFVDIVCKMLKGC